MTTTQIRIKTLTAGAVIATMAAPLLVLGLGTAHAGPDISTIGPVAAIGDLPVPVFNPQPDPPGNPDSDSNVDTDTKVDSSLGGPDTKVGTRIDPQDPNRPGRASSSSLNPGETVGDYPARLIGAQPGATTSIEQAQVRPGSPGLSRALGRRTSPSLAPASGRRTRASRRTPAAAP